MNDWVNDSPLKEIAFKAIMLLLQKPLLLKRRDHVFALERRLNLWYEGKVLELLKRDTIQKSLESSEYSSKKKKISKRFATYAIKVLTSNMQNGKNEKSLQKLRQKRY